ncbi:ArdC family protein [Castellaniella sp.]|uniref:ArdC family protein n=1 Tax=Castellaniella sp. TaxID=1955812 RepID=UPI002AFE9A53|nr:ArdC-like ssDNA-binding domain-containing protein [Castellaniella sp.]
MAAKEDFRQRLTNGFARHLEEHADLPWARAGAAVRPFNPASGVKFKGGNVMSLMLAQLERGSADPRWMTLKQANKAGYSVRKGAKAAYVEYWDWGVPGLHLSPAGAQDAEDDETEAQARARTKPRVFYAAVFNGEDIVGLPDVAPVAFRPHELAEKLIAATGAEIEYATVSRLAGKTVKNAVHYSRRTDRIVIPPKDSFKSADDFYATVLRELALWTGHPSRLNRPAEKSAGEGLRTEIAARLLISTLGLKGTAIADADHQFPAVWLDEFKGDKHALFRAARDAEQIVEHLFGYAPELLDTVEASLAANVLPEGGGKRRIDIGVSDDLPNFVPPGAKPVEKAPPTGRADPRWPGFEQAIYETARKAGFEAKAVDPVFDMIEGNFTQIMDGMKSRGTDEDTVYKMIGAKIIDEMTQADVYRKRLDEFADKVRAGAAGVVEPESVELALQETGVRYQQTLVDGVNNRWDNAQLVQALDAVLYGPGVAADAVVFDGAFARKLVEGSAAAQSLADLDDDDDVLMPLGMSAVLPEDAGVIDDERIARPGL